MISFDPRRDVQGSFRHVLRRSSRAAHDAAETRFAKFNDDPGLYLDWFLAAQRSGLAALQMARDPGVSCLSAVVLEDLIERLDFDLAVRGVQPVATLPDRGQGDPMQPLAVDYLVLGSRLGTEVLRRRLERQAPDGRMPTYFLAPASTDLWKRHCAHLDALDPDCAEAHFVMADVQQGFALFDKAAAAQRALLPDVPIDLSSGRLPEEGTAA